MFINPLNSKRRCRAFSLVETMVAAGVSSLVMMALASFSLYSARSFASMSNYADLETQSRMALDRMTQQIRQTRGLISYSSTNLVFKDADGAPLEFAYDPAAKTFTRTKDGSSTVLLQGCDLMTFEIFQRNPVKGGYDVYPTGSAATCKLIQFTWVCSRTLLGLKLNTETVQSAKIVIRKKD